MPPSSLETLGDLTTLTSLALDRHWALSAMDVLLALLVLPSLRYALLLREPRLDADCLRSMLEQCPRLALLQTDWTPEEEEEDSLELAASERLRLQHSFKSSGRLRADLDAHEALASVTRALLP